MLTLQSLKSQIVCLLIFKVNQDSLGDVILLTLQGVFLYRSSRRIDCKEGGQCLVFAC